MIFWRISGFAQTKAEGAEGKRHSDLQLLTGSGWAALISALWWQQQYQREQHVAASRDSEVGHEVKVLCWKVWHWNRLPRVVVKASRLLKFNRHLDNVLRYRDWILNNSLEPSTELYDLCGSLLIPDILILWGRELQMNAVLLLSREAISSLAA